MLAELGVNAGCGMLERARVFFNCPFPLSRDDEIALTGRHGHSSWEHDSTPFGMKLELRPPCLLRIVIAKELQDKDTLQASLNDNVAKFRQKNHESRPYREHFQFHTHKPGTLRHH